MAFATFNPADLDSAIQSICTHLASAHGWSTSYNAGTGTINITGKTATFTLTNAVEDKSSSYGYLNPYLILDVTNVTTPWQTRCNALYPLTKMWVFSGTTPEPWVHVVFESAPRFYHHVHFGYVERLGGYTGGAIADSTGWRFASSLTQYTWSNDYTNMLFGGFDIGVAQNFAKPGAMEIEHVDAAYSTYHFVNEANGSPRAGGGWGDGYNATLCWANATSIEDHVIFHPVVLFADLQSDYWVRPVATIPGLRMINIKQFQNATLVSAGNKNWRVFPLCFQGTRLNHEEGPGYVGGGSIDQHTISGITSNLGIAVLEE